MREAASTSDPHAAVCHCLDGATTAAQQIQDEILVVEFSKDKPKIRIIHR